VGPGDVVDSKYQIARRLGQGGMGAVYEARHLGTGRRVAVKIISGGLQTNSELVARFQREARAAGAIESQHVAHVLDTGTDAKSGHPYLVMEFLSGRDLQQTIKDVGPLSPEIALRVVAQAGLGLLKAHDAGVIHRDLKPANIFLAKQDAGDVVVKLLDFGIAKMKMDQFSTVGAASLTQSASMLGSPHYMSPEQAKGAKHIDHRTDIWSLGIVLYEALAGVTPFAEYETIGSLIIAICTAPPPPVQDRAPWVPSSVAAIVHRAIAPDVSDRFQSVADMVGAARALLPSGHALNETMLAPMPLHERQVVAPRLQTQSQVPVSVVPLRSSMASSPAGGSTLTAAGLETSRAPIARSRNSLLVLGLMGFFLLGGGLGTWFALRRPVAERGQAAGTSASASPLPTPVPSLSMSSAAVPTPSAVSSVEEVLADSGSAATSTSSVPVATPVGSSAAVASNPATRRQSHSAPAPSTKPPASASKTDVYEKM
jgi:serine/threonine-protein kinase